MLAGMDRVRACFALLPLVLLVACGGENGNRYRVVNDSGVGIRVMGCEGCASGRAIAAGDEASVRASNGRLQFVKENGEVYGCVAFVGGEPQDDEEQLRVSRFSVDKFTPANARSCVNGTFGRD